MAVVVVAPADGGGIEGRCGAMDTVGWRTSGARVDGPCMDADVGIGSLGVGVCDGGGGSGGSDGGGPAFSLHGHTGRMASMNCAASDAEVKLT